MSDSLNRAIALYAAGLGVWALLSLARGKGLAQGHLGALIVLEVALLGQALAALASVALGSRPGETATYLGYLAASVLLVPVVAPAARAGSRWDAGVIAVVCLALAVVCVRLRATWGPVRG